MACCAPLLAGCSSSSGFDGSSTVNGQVTFNGSPVAGARVIFTDGMETNDMAVNGPSAITDEDGEYAIIGLEPGTYKVVIYKLALPEGGELPEGIDLEQIEAANQEGGYELHALPKKYAKPTTTTLTAQIEDGSNDDVNFDLKGTAGD